MPNKRDARRSPSGRDRRLHLRETVVDYMRWSSELSTNVFVEGGLAGMRRTYRSHRKRRQLGDNCAESPG